MNTQTTLGYVKSTILNYMADGKEHTSKEIRQYLNDTIGDKVEVGNFIASALRDLSINKKDGSSVLRNPKRGIYVKAKTGFKGVMEDTFDDAIALIDAKFRGINVLDLSVEDYDLMLKYRDAFKNLMLSVQAIKCEE